jgi:hypothetical protein
MDYNPYEKGTEAWAQWYVDHPQQYQAYLNRRRIQLEEEFAEWKLKIKFAHDTQGFPWWIFLLLALFWGLVALLS